MSQCILKLTLKSKTGRAWNDIKFPPREINDYSLKPKPKKKKSINRDISMLLRGMDIILKKTS